MQMDNFPIVNAGGSLQDLVDCIPTYVTCHYIWVSRVMYLLSCVIVYGNVRFSVIYG